MEFFFWSLFGVFTALDIISDSTYMFSFFSLVAIVRAALLYRAWKKNTKYFSNSIQSIHYQRKKKTKV